MPYDGIRAERLLLACILGDGKHTTEFSYGQVLELARGARGQDPHGYRCKFLSLVSLANSLAPGSQQR